MSKSQIKRLHQQQELEKVSQSTEEQEEEELAPQRKGPANRFAFFDDEDEGGNQSDDGDAPGADEAAAQQKKARNRAKKNKKKASKSSKEEAETEAQMLHRLALENRKAAKEAVSVANTPSVEELMKIDIKMFDMSAEIKRKLGKAFKDAVPTDGQQDENRWPAGKRATGRIVKNKPRWFPARDYGLSMVQAKEENGITWFLIKHNNYYENRERMYWMAERQMNIGIVHEILSDTSYHLNSLLMMANMSRMNEDFNQSADYIERGIFYVDQYACSTFEPFNWRHRMDYTDYTNRAFFLLLHRHMLNAASKRCWETAWNTAKLIFKLDPIGDPLAIMSLIDTYALRAKQYQWIVNMYAAAKDFKKLHLLPNWPYSVALAQFQIAKTDADKEKAEDVLCSALRHFPSFVVSLMESLQIQPDPDVANCSMFSSLLAQTEKDSLKLLIKIYTKETEELWKQSETLLFLERATRRVAVSTEDRSECDEWKRKRNKMYQGSSPNVLRLGQLLELVPATSISDPCPPANGRMQYKPDDVGRQNDGARRDTSFLSEFLRSLMPTYDLEDPDAFSRYGHEFAQFMDRQANGAREIVGNIEDIIMGWVRARPPGDPLPDRVLEVVRRHNPEEEVVVELPEAPQEPRDSDEPGQEQ